MVVTNDKLFIDNLFTPVFYKVAGDLEANYLNSQMSQAPYFISCSCDLGTFLQNRRFQSKINKEWIKFLNFSGKEFGIFVKNASTLSPVKIAVFEKNFTITIPYDVVENLVSELLPF